MYKKKRILINNNLGRFCHCHLFAFVLVQKEHANIGSHTVSVCVFIWSTWAWNLFLCLLSTAREQIRLIFLWATVDKISLTLNLSFSPSVFMRVFNGNELNVFVCDKTDVFAGWNQYLIALTIWLGRDPWHDCCKLVYVSAIEVPARIHNNTMCWNQYTMISMFRASVQS